jgi:hypothetical protein
MSPATRDTHPSIRSGCAGHDLVIVWSYGSRTYRGGGRVFRWSGHDDRRHEWHAVNRGDRGQDPEGARHPIGGNGLGSRRTAVSEPVRGLPQTSRPLKAASGATAFEQSRRRPPATPLPSAPGWRSVRVAMPPQEERTWTTDREAIPARLRSARSGRQANDQRNRHTAGGHIRTGLE